VPGVADVGRRDLLEDLADAALVGALVQGRRDGDAFVDRAPDLGGGGGRVLRLDDRPADDDDAGAGRDRRRRRLGVDAAGHRDGDRDGLSYGLEGGERRLTAHLLVDRRVDGDVVGAERLGLSRAGDRVGHLDHVDDELAAVVARRLGALLDRAVGRGAQDSDDGGAGLGRVLDLDPARVDGLHVGDDHAVGEGRLELAHGAEALRLDQRRAGLDPVGAAGHGLLGDEDRARQVDEVEGDLEDDAPVGGVCGSGSHTPVTCTTMRRSRGRASKSQKTMF